MDDPQRERESPGGSKKSRKSPLIWIGLGLGALLLLALGLWLTRGWIAESRLESALAARGMRCAPLSLSVGWTLRSATLAPTRCTLEEGSVEALVFAHPVEIELEGQAPSALHIAEAELHLRARSEPLAPGQWLAGAVEQLAQDQVVGMVHGLRELSRRRLPSSHIARATLKRSGEVVGSLSNMHLERDGAGLELQVDAVELGRQEALIGSASAHLESVRGHAASDEVELNGVLVTEARVILLGSLGRQRSPVTLRVRGLDGAQPRYELSLGNSP